MSVTIIRHMGWFGIGATLAIKINGEKVAKIRENQQIEVELPAGPTTLSVSQLGTKSNLLNVQDGETVEVTNTLLAKTSLLWIALPLFLVNLLPEGRVQGIVRVCTYLLLLGTVLLINSHHLEKI